jgi:hypothetical protein
MRGEGPERPPPGDELEEDRSEDGGPPTGDIRTIDWTIARIGSLLLLS